MGSSKRQRLEEQLHELCRFREYHRAIVLALQGYGPDIRKLMMVILKNKDWVNDAFGTFCESLIKSLPDFRWESSFRTWAYRVARHACAHYTRSRHDREQLATDSALANQPLPERTVTQPWLRTEIKNHFRALQEKLSPHEQALLILRIERKLPWNDVARAMAGRELSAEELMHKVAVLRQQFHRLKLRLREFAVEESLLQSEAH